MAALKVVLWRDVKNSPKGIAQERLCKIFGLSEGSAKTNLLRALEEGEVLALLVPTVYQNCGQFGARILAIANRWVAENAPGETLVQALETNPSCSVTIALEASKLAALIQKEEDPTKAKGVAVCAPTP